jgi:hypothetical protein
MRSSAARRNGPAQGCREAVDRFLATPDVPRELLLSFLRQVMGKRRRKRYSGDPAAHMSPKPISGKREQRRSTVGDESFSRNLALAISSQG